MDAVRPIRAADAVAPRARSPRRRRAAPARSEVVRLLDVEPDLAAVLPDADVPDARRLLVMPSMRLATGPWSAPPELGSAIGLLVVGGLVTCTSCVFGSADVRLVGPGDLFDAGLLCPEPTTWRVLTPTLLAVLDGRLLLAAHQWPQLVLRLARRVFEGEHELHRLAALRALPQVEQRLLALLSHVASRWGRVTPDGVTVVLPVTHEVLGELVGARRPTVSLALSTLRDAGLLARSADGRWLLPFECAEWSETGVPEMRAGARA